MPPSVAWKLAVRCPPVFHRPCKPSRRGESIGPQEACEFVARPTALLTPVEVPHIRRRQVSRRSTDAVAVMLVLRDRALTPRSTREFGLPSPGRYSPPGAGGEFTLEKSKLPVVSCPAAIRTTSTAPATGPRRRAPAASALVAGRDRGGGVTARIARSAESRGVEEPLGAMREARRREFSHLRGRPGDVRLRGPSPSIGMTRMPRAVVCGCTSALPEPWPMRIPVQVQRVHRHRSRCRSSARW